MLGASVGLTQRLSYALHLSETEPHHITLCVASSFFQSGISLRVALSIVSRSKGRDDVGGEFLVWNAGYINAPEIEERTFAGKAKERCVL